MSSKYFLLLLPLTMTGLNIKSQTLLNAYLPEISKDIELKGGVLKRSFTEKNKEMNGYYKKVMFLYPLPPEGNSCLIKCSFYLNVKNKCFKYEEDYWGKELPETKINELKRYYSGLKRVKEEFRWVDINRRFEVDLIPKKIGNNKFASEYILKIKQI